MSEFVFLFRASEAENVEHMGTPERAQRSMQAWLGWIRGLEAKGHLKDPGQPLDRAGKVVRAKNKVVTDGPYAEAKEVIGGWAIVQFDTEDEARAEGQKMADLHLQHWPGWEGAIEMRRISEAEEAPSGS
jgi:hypothetical protein